MNFWETVDSELKYQNPMFSSMTNMKDIQVMNLSEIPLGVAAIENHWKRC